MLKPIRGVAAKLHVSMVRRTSLRMANFLANLVSKGIDNIQGTWVSVVFKLLVSSSSEVPREI